MPDKNTPLPIAHRRLIYFDFTSSIDNKGPEWLQITSVDNIGSLSTDVRQKIIRIPEDRQMELMYMLLNKFYPKADIERITEITKE